MAAPVDSVERLMWWLFGSSMGAATRAWIVVAVREQPRNTQELADMLGLDYTTIRHHLRLLRKNGLLVTSGDHYGQLYFLAPPLENRWETFLRIVEKMRTKPRGETVAAT